MSRKRCHRRVWLPLPPRGLRPKLSRAQVTDLALAHLVNLDDIARGNADESTLWQACGGVLTWSRAAELLGDAALMAAMAEQLQVLTSVVERYRRTGRVGFSGQEYQLAKAGVELMDDLAERVDRPTAVAAAEWGEARVNEWAGAALPAGEGGVTHSRVTSQGRAMGQSAARLAELGRARLSAAGLDGLTGARLRADMCSTCACRPGSVPNGCLQTQMDFLKAAAEGKPFLCHAPRAGKVCVGWMRARAQLVANPLPPQAMELIAKWQYSPPDEESPRQNGFANWGGPSPAIT